MDAIAQLRAALDGRYAIERQVGAGGMATVYLARDIRHDRHVALKVLKPELGARLGVERFLAEIRVTANLQHPNLLPLFDSGEAQGLLYYVMPYVEGESLRGRLKREKQLRVADALRITSAVASALDYAHRQGVIHRDLKPENILLHEGQPLIADFGIALAVSNAGGTRITETGLSLGTPQYMSPEQVTGDRVIDGRTDIYSLAAVLYEMLTGEPPHSGTTAQAIIAKVLTDAPRGVRLIRPTVPEHVEAAIDVALSKLPADRWSTTAEFAAALQGEAAPRAPATRARGRRQAAGWIAAGAGFVAGALLWAGVERVADRNASTDPAAAQVIELPADAPLALGNETPSGGYSSPVLALSPAGTWLAYVAQTASGRLLYLRDMRTGATRPVRETDGVLSAAFSPDGREIAFITSERVKRVPVSGGAVVTLCEADRPAFVWWPRADTIYFTENETLALSRVAAAGGPVGRVLGQRTGDGLVRRYYDILPTGKVLLDVGAFPAGDSRDVAVADPETGTETIVLRAGYAPRFAPPGFVLFVRVGQLMAVRFDLGRTSAEGSPSPIVDEFAVQSLFGIAHAAMAGTGVLAYAPGIDLSKGKLAWVDRSGATTFEAAPERVYGALDLAPDDVRIAVEVADVKNYAYVWDSRRGEGTRLESEGGEVWPMWSRDGSRLASAVQTAQGWHTAIRDAQSSGTIGVPRFVRHTEWAALPGWSPDGRQLALGLLAPARTNSTVSGRRVEFVQLNGQRPPDGFEGWNASYSPDGKWVVHFATVGSSSSVMLRSLSTGRTLGPVATGGAVEPRWKPNGDLYFRNGTRWYVTHVTTSPEPTWDPPRLAFQTDFIDAPGPSYDVSSDGTRLLVVKRATAVPRDRIVIVPNWLARLERQ